MLYGTSLTASKGKGWKHCKVSLLFSLSLSLSPTLCLSVYVSVCVNFHPHGPESWFVIPLPLSYRVKLNIMYIPEGDCVGNALNLSGVSAEIVNKSLAAAGMPNPSAPVTEITLRRQACELLSQAHIQTRQAGHGQRHDIFQQPRRMHSCMDILLDVIL